MYDFGEPDKTLDLTFEELHRNYGTRQQIKCSTFPGDSHGAYVIRLAESQIRRLKGESSIIKIGDCAAGSSFRKRFTFYNQKCDAVAWNDSLSAYMKQWRGGRSDAHVVWLLRQLSNADKLLVDFYFGKPESDFLDAYLDSHWELPPANFSRRIPGQV